MDIHGFKARSVEGCRHLRLSIHPLLAQDRNFWSNAGRYHGCRDISVNVETELRGKTWIFLADLIELLVSAVSIISLALNRMRVLSPELLKRAAATVDQLKCRGIHDNALI